MKKINYSEISKQKLEYLNYSRNTIKLYLHYINEFIYEITSRKCPTNINS